MPSRFLLVLSSLFVFSVFFGCTDSPPDESTGEGTEIETPSPVPGRIVAIGDIHGDIEAARAALRMAQAVDINDHWAGGNMVLVQTGDILDRGDDEEEIFELFRQLKVEAEQAGGAVHVLNGNHELMNAYLDFRYVTEGGLADFEESSAFTEVDSVLASVEEEYRGRAAAFRPGGPEALHLAENKTAVIVGSTVFAHGGVLPANVELGLDQMNEAVRQWLIGEAPQPEWIRGDDSPVWNRLYSSEPDYAACGTLSSVLSSLGVERMVVGHTVQRTGITSFCGGRLWSIDVGMAAHYGGRPEVLEIRGNVVKSIR